jgi:hypothetical protein
MLSAIILKREDQLGKEGKEAYVVNAKAAVIPAWYAFLPVGQL